MSDAAAAESRPRFQARLKPEFQIRYPELRRDNWYDVEPLWPGLRERMTTMAGDRLTRLRVGEEYLTVRAEHLEFRPAGA
jgi:hypothetical protein